MEPLKIQVEVNLSEVTLEALRALLSAATLTQAVQPDQKKEETKEETKEEQPKAPAEDIPEDMPDFTEVSDTELANATREAVARIKAQRKSPVFIRTTIFAKYGISQSIECPMDKRAALLEDLKHAGEE